MDGKKIFITFQLMAVCLLKPAIKAYSVAINITQENRVCNKLLSIVAHKDWKLKMTIVLVML